MLRNTKPLLQSVMLTILVMLTVGQHAFAVWYGMGEVTGTVLTARRVGARVDFEMTIATQHNELHGSTLASPNHFTYSGPQRLEISPGDKLRLRVRYSNAFGIIVERLEWLENQPGTPEAISCVLSPLETAQSLTERVILGMFAVWESPLASSLLGLLLLTTSVLVGVLVWRRRVGVKTLHKVRH